MTYVTESDLVIQFGSLEMESLLDRDRDGSADVGVLDDAIAFAQTLIDGYLRERYPLPLGIPPRSLIGFAGDIARYRLYQNQPSDLVQLRYDAALQWLKDVSRGLVTLDVVEDSVAKIAHSTPLPVFTRLVW